MRDLQYLAIMALSPSDTALFGEISRITAQQNCQLLNCHINQQGTLYAINFLLCGAWSAIAKVEVSLAALQAKQSMPLFMQRTAPHTHAKAALPYILYITATNQTDVLHQLLTFLRQEELTIQEIQGNSYTTRLTQANMLSITIHVQLAANINISEWRERLMVFCDEINVDLALEPDKS